jgi:hypothetical protein
MSAKPSLSGGNFVLIMIITVDIQHPGIVAAWAVCSLPLSVCFRQEQGRELGRLPTVSCGNGATAEPCPSWLMCRLCQPKDTGRAQIQALDLPHHTSYFHWYKEVLISQMQCIQGAMVRSFIFTF